MVSVSLHGSVLLLALASAHADTFTCTRRRVVDEQSARCSFTAPGEGQKVTIRRVDVWANAPGWFCGSTDVQVSVGGRSVTLKGINEDWKGSSVAAVAHSGDHIDVVTKNLNSHCDADIETKVTYDVLEPEAPGVEVQRCREQDVHNGATARVCGFGRPYPLEVVGFEMGVELDSWWCSGSSDLRVEFGNFVRHVEVANGGSVFLEMSEQVLRPDQPVHVAVTNQNSHCDVVVTPKVSFRRFETPAPPTPVPTTAVPPTPVPTTATPTPTVATEPCQDKASEQYCVGYKHLCKYNDFAADCAATCNTCTAPKKPEPSCQDVDERYCVVYKHLCYIQNFKEEQCPATCGACPEQ